MVRALTTGTVGTGSRQILALHPACNRYMAFFRAVEGGDVENEAPHPTSFTPLPL